MKWIFCNAIGQSIMIQTSKGMEIGVVEKVNDHGIELRPLTESEQTGLVGVNLHMADGFYPWQGILGYSYQSSSNGFGLGISMGGFGGWSEPVKRKRKK